MNPSHPYAHLLDGWKGRPAVALVDLDALRGNITTLRHIIGPDVRLVAVVKANAYGHGSVPIAREAITAGADMLAVATVDEAAQLRQGGIDTDIMVLGALGRAEIGRALSFGLQLVVSNTDFLDAVLAEVVTTRQKGPVRLHLKVDTGMRRFGAPLADVAEIAHKIQSEAGLELASVMTHLAAADAPDESSAFAQADVLDACLARIADAGIEVPVVQIANSAATLRFPELYRSQVRVGIAMYGLRPDVLLPLPTGMRPVLTVYGRISRVIDVAAGDTVGYGRTYRAETSHRAGLISFGYADGYRRGLSSRAWMSLHGTRADVLGRVSMDQSVVALPGSLGELGDIVTIVGDGTEGTSGAPTLDELAAMCDTISYEMATGLTARLPRLYVREGELVGVGDLAGFRNL